MENGKNKLIKNFSFLTIIQLLSLLVPFIYYPHLVDVFGSESLGYIFYAQSIVLIAIVFIDFGFNLSAVRSVALARDDTDKLSVILFSVLYIKLIIFLGFGLLLSIVLENTTYLAGDKNIYYLSYINAFGSVVLVQWFFQGMEKISTVAIVSIFFKFILLFLIYSLVHHRYDQYIYLIIFGSTNVMIGITTLIYAVINNNLTFPKIKPSDLYRTLIDSYAFFLSRISGTIALRLPSVFIGNYVGMQYVAFYDLAEKLLNLLLIPINILNQVVYPSVSRSKNIVLVLKAIALSLAYSVFVVIGVFIFSSFLIELYVGQDMIPAQGILYYIVWLVPINAISYFIGNCVLIIMSLERSFNRSVFFGILTSCIYVTLAMLFVDLKLQHIMWFVLINGISVLVYRLFSSFRLQEFRCSLWRVFGVSS